MSRRSWSPSIVAAAIGIAMIWLAGAPLAPRPTEAALLEPFGTLDAFPRRFAWTPVPRAEVYEITVAPAGGEPLFRQRGAGTVLEIGIDEGAEPPPGSYTWEVVAYGYPGELARARAGFVVSSP